ncbi:hypothetical protein K353_05853 [Kitasatospora sp. SolWspMP-SS2h]|uniref:hypothetical protein n=1 Tax=Kitasatospora sp. SolWspMP-SS2h TaxID=1305729 RepID=UPI000DBA4FAE|nr:hypothetical protein [Kitasatospora sp. SolWspMP-SS2h]RAJ32855.1 hypothetical protein K353_05853 [Kitasatospora sp. SolWspMP-SS2h]
MVAARSAAAQIAGQREANRRLVERFARLAEDPAQAQEVWRRHGLAPLPIGQSFAVVELPGRIWGQAALTRLEQLARGRAVPIGPVLQHKAVGRGRAARTQFLTAVPARGTPPWGLPVPQARMRTSGVLDMPSPTGDARTVEWLVPPHPDHYQWTDPWLLAVVLERVHRELRRSGAPL